MQPDSCKRRGLGTLLNLLEWDGLVKGSLLERGLFPIPQRLSIKWLYLTMILSCIALQNWHF